MKKIIYSFGIFIILSFIFSCGNTRYIPVTDTIPISEYTTYIFRLCEYRDSYGNARYFLCDTPCEATDIQANDNVQVVEELYAFQSPTNEEDIIYMTSKSDKYILENGGIFNADLYKKYIVASDLEYVYFGKKTARKIDFVNTAEALTFWLKQTPEDCRFVVDSIYSETAVKNAISNKKLDFKSIFSVPVQFIKTDRKLVHSRKDTNAIVEKLILKERKIIFEGTGKTHSISQKRRLKYHPIYLEKHDSLIAKIKTDSVTAGKQLKLNFEN